MLKDVTLGRYCEKEGLLHKLNPVFKLCVLTLILITVFLSSSSLTLLVPLCFFIIIFFASGLKLRWVFRGLFGYFIAIFVFTFLRYALSGFTTSGAVEALTTALRLILIVLFSSLYSGTTRADDSARALEWIFGVNGRYVSLVFSVALRFIPVLSEQAGKIKMAQISRCGLSYAKGSLRFKALLSVLIPLFASSYRRAVALSMAMDSRCFSPEGSTHLNKMSFSYSDAISSVLTVIYLAVFCLVRFVWKF